MRALSDKWSPRLWMRDWLNKPSQAELVERRAAEAAAAQMLAEIERQSGADRSAEFRLELDAEARISGLSFRPLPQRGLTQ